MEGPAGSAQAYTSSSWDSVSGVATLRWETADKTRATMPARESAVIHPPSHTHTVSAVSVSAPSLARASCWVMRIVAPPEQIASSGSIRRRDRVSVALALALTHTRTHARARALWRWLVRPPLLY